MMSWLWQQNVDTVTILLLFSLNLQFAIWTYLSPEFNCFLFGTNCLCDVFYIHSKYTNYCQFASAFLKELLVLELNGP